MPINLLGLPPNPKFKFDLSAAAWGVGQEEGTALEQASLWSTPKVGKGAGADGGSTAEPQSITHPAFPLTLSFFTG